jgi:hypothetical protein
MGKESLGPLYIAPGRSDAYVTADFADHGQQIQKTKTTRSQCVALFSPK